MKRYSKKIRKYRKARFYKRPTTMSMYMEHTFSYGVTTDGLGTDGAVA